MEPFEAEFLADAIVTAASFAEVKIESPRVAYAYLAAVVAAIYIPRAIIVAALVKFQRAQRAAAPQPTTRDAGEAVAAASGAQNATPANPMYQSEAGIADIDGMVRG